MSHYQDNIAHGEHAHEGGLDKKGIWKVFGVLLALTCLEFLIALGFVHHWQILAKGTFVNALYIVLTLVKAYYIVAYFMHLKFEKSSFIVTVGIVFIFIIYFIILLLDEGNHLGQAFQEHQLFPNK
ncbi:cytochrome C oxidase subunit IV family protein [Sphingobacterium sp. HMA12]|jgi:cytochrome c oxidase subunit 4|uniref:cytochrome C oxidase subunit IV family protein n=1 Tax=Sphingobacterium sp. HMA12 TaxID=2050894 RepID=UPI000CEA0E96|nr:cytochrome C oxidase subunit IV family protein [Sphingobacterium sp. HMA12]